MKLQTPIFKGIGTALVTPMTENGVDYDALEILVSMQLMAGVDALIVCATTGEAPTLADDEHIDVIKAVVRQVNKKIPVIAGTGSNYTDHAVNMSQKAWDVGADALLCVTPYYNKCTQRGIIENYYKIADSTDLPVIVYNVPSRTGVEIKPETYAVLAEHDRIVAIKEAGGNISNVVATMGLCGDKIDMYSGNDDQIVPIMSMGGIGCISTMANILPSETKKITTRFFEGDIEGAARLQCRYKPLIDALFSEVNPIPVKTALAAMGVIKPYLRLPLTPMDEKNKKELLRLMRNEGIKV